MSELYTKIADMIERRLGNSEIARRAGASKSYVEKIRAEIGGPTGNRGGRPRKTGAPTWAGDDRYLAALRASGQHFGGSKKSGRHYAE